MAANVFEEKFGPAQPLPPLAGAQDVSAQGAPAASGATAQAAPAPQGNPDNVFEKMFGPATGATPPPPTEEAPPPKQPNALEQFGHALDADVEAGLARVPAAVQEAYGNSKYNSARARMWQAMILPDALRYAQQHQSSLTDDPLVQSTAKHLGMRVDQFTRDWPDYAGKSDAELQKIQADAKVDMADGANWKQKGEAGRKMAGQIEQGYGTIAGDHPIENEALHLASIAPELSAPLIAGAVAGPPGAIAAGSVVAGDFAARGYSSAKDAGAPEAAAQLYGALSAAAMLVPEIPVIDAVSKDAVPILSKAFAKQAGQTAVNQGAAMGVQQALIIGLNKGVLNQDTSLPDALRQIGVAMVEGHIIGAGMQTAHTAITNARAGGGPQPTPGAESAPPAATPGAEPADALTSVEGKTTPPPVRDPDAVLAAQLRTAGRFARQDAGPVVEGEPHVIQKAENAAETAALAKGGDALDGKVAAIQASAEVGAHHDAAAVQGARDAEAQHVAGAMELRRQQAMQADADEQALIDQGQRESGLNQAQAATAPKTTPADAFARAESDQAAKWDSDYAAAKNQVGDQAVEAAKTAESGAEKGGANEPKSTVSDALPPEQLARLQDLKERRAAEAAKSKKAQAADDSDHFVPLPPDAPKAPVVDRMAAIKAAADKVAAQKRTATPAEAAEPAKPAEKASATDADDTLPEKGPPAPTAQTLADVRKANFAKELAAKVRQPLSETTAPLQRNANNLHGEPIAERQAREAEFNRDAAYKNLMVAKPEDVSGLVGKMSPEDAAAHLSRLDAAPGDNPLARAALETRATVEGQPGDVAREEPTLPPTEREELPESPAPTNLADRRQARQAKQAQRRVQFADATARIRPEDVAYSYENGEHTVVTPGGSTRAVDTADNNLRITRDDTEKSARGQGAGTARAERLAQEVHSRGGRLTSDSSVSPDHERVWDALARRGYGVQRNPNAVRNPETGNLVTDHPNNPIFTAGPKRDPATENGLALRRRADAGDQSAHEELARRATAANEPRTPEEGALADRRDVEQERDTAPAALAAVRQRNAAAAAQAARPRLTKEQGEAALKPILDRLPGARGAIVHASADTLPQHIQDLMRPGSRNEHAPAVYDRDTDTVHMIADRHSTPEQFQRKAIHEIVGHQGLRRLLGPDFGDVMDGIAKKADTAGKEWMREYAAEKELNLEDSAQLAADEWAAHLAEFTTDSPSAWRKIVDAVRAGLRSIPGIGQHMEWTEDDVRALIRKSENGLRTFNPRVKQLQDNMGRLRFAGSDDVIHPDLPPDHPLAVNEKLGKLAADQENYSPATIRSIQDWGRTVDEQLKGYKESTPAKVKELRRKATEQSFGMLFLHNLPDFLNERTRPLMPSPERFLDTHEHMEIDTGRRLSEGGKIAADWQLYTSKDKDAGEPLLNLMHDSTLFRTDPSKEYKPVHGDERVAADTEAAQSEQDRRIGYDALKKQYQALSPKGKELYATVRDHYSEMRDNNRAALEQRITDTQAPQKTKDKYIDILRKQFEKQQGIEPYFPLNREGEHWASAKDEDGNTVAFARFDSGNKQHAWKAEAEKRNFTVEMGQDMDLPSDREKLDPNFAADVAEMAKDISPEFAEDVWAHYLRSMPEMSEIKRGLPRAGRLGYVQDALHNFKNAVQRNALTESRLKYGHKLAEFVEKAKSEAHSIKNNPDLPEDDKRYTTALAKELAERNKLITDPHSAGPAARIVTKYGFAYYLWNTPATAFRILSQNLTMALPQLGGRFGYLRSSGELAKGSGIWGKAVGSRAKSLFDPDIRNRNRAPDSVIRVFLDQLRDPDKNTPGERTAMEDMAHAGLLGNTWAKTLISGGPRAPGEAESPVSAALRVGGALFNIAEQHNRLSTGLAAYRLGIKDDMSHEDASKYARGVLRSAHVPYDLANRPRYLQTTDTGRVLGQFKLYPATVAYNLMREARNTMRMDGGITPQQRAQSAKTLAGYLGGAGLFAGVTGLPLYWLVSGAVNAFQRHVAGDDSFDMTNEMKQYFAQMLGQSGASATMHGPASELSGYDLGSAADYSNLFFHSSDQDKNWEGMLGDTLAELGGSPVGIAMGGAQGLDTATGPNGDVERGLEHGLPTMPANLLKGIRFYLHGAQDMKGDPIIPREDIGTAQAFARAMGFNPLKLVEQQETNTAFRNAQERIMARKHELEDGYDRAAKEGNTARLQELSAEIAKHNVDTAGNTEAQISGRGQIASVLAKAKARAATVSGVNPTGYEGLARKFGITRQQP